MKLSLKEKILTLSLSYKKEISTILIVNILIIAIDIPLFVLLKQIVVVALAAIVLVTFNYFYLSRYDALILELNKQHRNELISLLSYFEIFIDNNSNVYHAFQLLLPYCSPFMEEAINSLLNHIDNDKSVQPYIAFSNKFNDKTIDSLMLSLYQMVENGENTKEFDEFKFLFKTISVEYHNSLIESKKRSLDVFNSFPLFAAGAIVVVLTLCILTVVGGMVNVI